MAKKVKVEIFEDVRQALTDAAAWERGERWTCASVGSLQRQSP